MERKEGKLQLPNVTLIAMTSVNVQATVKAMEYSMRGIDFYEAVLVTHKKPLGLPKTIQYKHTSKLTNIDDFNYKTVYELGSFVETEFALLVHADGFVVHPENWRDEFLDYDYIGSPWPEPSNDLMYRDIHGNICRVGNSVSIRSKRLMDFPQKIHMPWTPEDGCFNEDGFICCRMRHLFEAEGMTYAPIEVAKYFGHEHMIPEVQGLTPFVFHKWWGSNAQYPNFIKPSVKERVKAPLRKIRNTIIPRKETAGGSN